MSQPLKERELWHYFVPVVPWLWSGSFEKVKMRLKPFSAHQCDPILSWQLISMWRNISGSRGHLRHIELLSVHWGCQRLAFKYSSAYVSFIWESLTRLRPFSAHVQTDVWLIIIWLVLFLQYLWHLIQFFLLRLEMTTVYDKNVTYCELYQAQLCFYKNTKIEYLILWCITVAFTTALSCSLNSPLWRTLWFALFVLSTGSVFIFEL